MMIKINTINNDKKISALKALQSPVTKKVLNDMVQEVLDEIVQFKFDIKVEPVLSNYVIGRTYATIYMESDDLYDWLMNDPRTMIGDEISCIVEKTMYWASYGEDIRTELSFLISCKLPEDDFRTLDMLGKVHRELVPSRVNESIYCEI